MSEEQYTRCPGCHTVFRVTAQQLSMREGRVRCGHCRTVFDGIAALVSLAPSARNERDDSELDELALGPPTVTLRSAQALHAPPAAAEDEAKADAEAVISVDAKPAVSPGHEKSYGSRFSRQHWAKTWEPPPWLYAATAPFLVLLLLGQSLFHFRDAIAAHWPSTKSALVTLCTVASCRIHPLRDIAGLSIEASDLQADPAHKGLLLLSSTLRNRAPYPVAYPYLELTLSDTQDRVVVRRAFSPQEYASGAADVDGGISANSELNVKLFIDASATTQAGYQVYLFYP